MPEPAFNYDCNGLMLLFKGESAVSLEKEAVRNEGKMSGKASGKTSGKILELVKANPEITIPEIASIIGISVRSIERNIQKLKEGNLLKRIGADNGGRWEIVE